MHRKLNRAVGTLVIPKSLVADSLSAARLSHETLEVRRFPIVDDVHLSKLPITAGELGSPLGFGGLLRAGRVAASGQSGNECDGEDETDDYLLCGFHTWFRLVLACWANSDSNAYCPS